MKTKVLLIFMCGIFSLSSISCQTGRIVSSKTEDLSIGLTMYPSDLSVTAVQNAIESSLSNYYRLKFNVTSFQEFDTIMNGVNTNAEQYVKGFLKEHKLDYLVYVQNRRNLDLWLMVWNQQGYVENIIVPYSKRLETQLIDISVNAFISIIENMDNRLYANKLY